MLEEYKEYDNKKCIKMTGDEIYFDTFARPCDCHDKGYIFSKRRKEEIIFKQLSENFFDALEINYFHQKFKSIIFENELFVGCILQYLSFNDLIVFTSVSKYFNKVSNELMNKLSKEIRSIKFKFFDDTPHRLKHEMNNLDTIKVHLFSQKSWSAAISTLNGYIHDILKKINKERILNIKWKDYLFYDGHKTTEFLYSLGDVFRIDYEQSIDIKSRAWGHSSVYYEKIILISKCNKYSLEIQMKKLGSIILKFKNITNKN